MTQWSDSCEIYELAQWSIFSAPGIFLVVHQGGPYHYIDAHHNRREPFVGPPNWDAMFYHHFYTFRGEAILLFGTLAVYLGNFLDQYLLFLYAIFVFSFDIQGFL